MRIDSTGLMRIIDRIKLLVVVIVACMRAHLFACSLETCLKMRTCASSVHVH